MRRFSATTCWQSPSINRHQSRRHAWYLKTAAGQGCATRIKLWPLGAVLIAMLMVNASAAAASICAPIVDSKQVTYDPKLKPSYWITVAPNGHLLSYMTTVGNYMIDVSPQSQGATIKAPGKVDLQFSADGTYFTLVNKHRSAAKRQSFGVEHGTSWYAVKDLLAYFDTSKSHNPAVWDGAEFPHQARKVPRLAIDRTFFNHYHSMGKFTDSDGKVWERIMNDYRGASYRDYHWDQGKLTYKNPVYITSSAPLVDSQGNSYFDLPMMSRDGKWFAGFNRDTMTTQVYAIDPGDQRRLVLDLGMETGKVAFSYPQEGVPYLYLAFHVDFVVHEEGNKMSGAMISRSKDIMVLKLRYYLDDQGQPSLEKVGYATVTRSGVLGNGNYYPQWSADNHLFYVAVDKAKGTRSHQFVKTHIDRFPFQPFDLPQKYPDYAQGCGKQRFHALVAIGAAWAQQCSQFWRYLSATDAAITAMGLSSDQCAEAAKAWQQSSAQTLQMARLFKPRVPHNRSGRLRPDGRWTMKARNSRELVAERDFLSHLSTADISKACTPAPEDEQCQASL